MGELESVRLEFKAADAMGHPEAIVRAVVALLNTQGGEVWVGLGEQEGKAVSIQPLADPQRARIILRDKMVELIEPTPVDLVQPRVVGAVVVVRVEQGSERPYALKSGTKREYLGRFLDRTRMLSYEELRHFFSTGRGERQKALIDARRRVGALRSRVGRGLIFIAVPLPECQVATNQPAVPLAIQRVLGDHTSTGSRRMGWTFHHEQAQAKLQKGREVVVDAGLGDEIRLTARGEVVFSTRPGRLLWQGSRGPNPERDVHPIVLAELVTSAVRILKQLTLLRIHERTPDKWVLHLSLLGMAGWTLSGGSPLRWSVGSQIGTFEEDELSGSDVVIESAELDANPDRVALTLLKQLYADFQLTTDQLPPEFDQEQGVLRLND